MTRPPARPVVGIISNSHLVNDQYPAHAGGTMNSAAVAQVATGSLTKLWAMMMSELMVEDEPTQRRRCNCRSVPTTCTT